MTRRLCAHRRKGFPARSHLAGGLRLRTDLQPKSRVDECARDALAVLLAHAFAACHGIPARPDLLLEVIDNPGGFLPREEKARALREHVGHIRVPPVIADDEREVPTLSAHERCGCEVIRRGQPPLVLRSEYRMV